jgi:hypothetical protein
MKNVAPPASQALTWQASPNGVSWDVQATLVVTPPTSVQPFLKTYSNTTGATGLVSFDNFNVLP